MIFQFKILLKDVGVPVWRRLLVDSETTFEEFHYILMASFDWFGIHLYDFDVRKTAGKNLQFGEVRIGPTAQEEQKDYDFFVPFTFDDESIYNQSKEKLSNWFIKEKTV